MPLFLDAITTNETYFFRDTAELRLARRYVFLPEIIQQAALENDPRPCGYGRRPAAPVKSRTRSR